MPNYNHMKWLASESEQNDFERVNEDEDSRCQSINAPFFKKGKNILNNHRRQKNLLIHRMPFFSILFSFIAEKEIVVDLGWFCSKKIRRIRFD